MDREQTLRRMGERVRDEAHELSRRMGGVMDDTEE
jgi:hypothetical protein